MTAAIIPFAEIAQRREARRLAEKVVALPRVSAAPRLEPGTPVYILRSQCRGVVIDPPDRGRVRVRLAGTSLESFVPLGEVVTVGPGGAA